MKQPDVIVIGAGVAGLAAADALRRAGHAIVVLEARSRIGGRILTRRVPGLPVPVELGAEFIHGDGPQTRRVLRAAGVPWAVVDGGHVRLARGRIARPDDSWSAVDRVFRFIDTDGPDVSIARFLAARPGGPRLARARDSVAGFVQGFHAADLERISAQSLAPARGDSALASASHIGRVPAGYDVVPKWLARELAGAVRLRHVVTDIAWRRGRALVSGRHGPGSFRLRARAVVVTVPLGVLEAEPGRAGAIRFDPAPPALGRALEGLAMGTVLRLAVASREPLWTDTPAFAMGGAPRHPGFLHLSGASPFAVWWSAFPAESPLAIAWCGGPPAAAWSRRPVADILRAALPGLAHGLGTSVARLAGRVTGAWLHDWTADPYVRGAYSYTRVGGTGAARALARPVEGTLFFAGEATHEARSGTVEGALASGLRAARQVDRTFRG